MGLRCCIVQVHYSGSFYPESHSFLLDQLSSDDRLFLRNNDSAPIELGPDPRCHLDQEPRGNLGFVGGCHSGLHWAQEMGFAYALLLNPDIHLESAQLEALLQKAQEIGPNWVISPLLLREDQTIDSAGLILDQLYRSIDLMQGDANQLKGFLKVPGLCGAAMLFDLSIFPLADRPEGPFDPDFFAYSEDLEFSLYWHQQGGKMGILADHPIIHRRGGRSGLSGLANFWTKNPEIARRILVNRWIIIRRWVPKWKLWPSLPIWLTYEALKWAYLWAKVPALAKEFPKLWCKAFFPKPQKDRS